MLKIRLHIACYYGQLHVPRNIGKVLIYYYFFFGHGMQQFGVGISVLKPGLNPGSSGKDTRS